MKYRIENLNEVELFNNLLCSENNSFEIEIPDGKNESEFPVIRVFEIECPDVVIEFFELVEFDAEISEKPEQLNELLIIDDCIFPDGCEYLGADHD